MSGLGATLITFVPNTVIKSGDVNSNLSALNGALNPTFTTITVTGSSSLDNGAITTDGAGTLTSKFVKAVPAAVPGATTSYVLVQVSGNSTGRVSLGVNSNGSGNLRLSNNGSSYAVELTTDGTTLLLGGKAIPIQGAHSAGQPILSYGTGVPAALSANEVYFQLA